jgi:hypothetical protein
MLPLPTWTQLLTGPVLSLLFFKCIQFIQRSFTLVFSCLYITLHQINPLLLLTISLLPCSPITQ